MKQKKEIQMQQNYLNQRIARINLDIQSGGKSVFGKEDSRVFFASSFFFLLSLFFLVFYSEFQGAYSQREEFVDPLDSYRGESRYFKTFQESLYQEDRFLEELEDSDLPESYYRVFFNSQQQPDTIGYYSTQTDPDDGIKVTRLSQHVNSNREAYYVIKYQYSEVDPEKVRIKYFKDFYGRVISYVLYTWDEQSKKLLRVEHYTKTPFLNQMQLQGSHELTWQGEDPLSMTFYDKVGNRIERYTFQQGTTEPSDSNESGSLQGHGSDLSVGNNQIFIRYLRRYERFEGKGKEKTALLNCL